MDKKILKLLKFKKTEKISKIISVFNRTALHTDGKGFGVIVNNKDKCIGVITDGDIRRGLNKFNKNDDVKLIYNKQFSYADNKSSKTAMLQIFEKLINNKNYHFCLPILDKSKKLIDIVNYENFLNEETRPKCIRVKIPARISFVGGGTDFNEYLFRSRSYILSSAIQKYLTVSLYPRNDKKILISNYTNNTFLTFGNYKQLQKFKKNDLIVNLLKNKILNFGFDLEIFSDFEPKTGLGGSSILSIAILKILNLFKNIEEIDNFQLINEAYKSERLDTKIKGGWQDYLASTFGGFNWIDLYRSEFFVNRLNLDKKIQLELENNLLLIELGSRKSSGLIQTKKIDSYKKNPKSKIIKFNKTRNLSIDMKNYLIKGDLENFGKSMDLSWNLKKQISPKSSNKKIDKVYNEAKIGILCTEATLKTQVYNKYFDKNYKLVNPGKPLQKLNVNKAIKYVKMGKIKLAEKAIKPAVNELIKMKCKKIILGCTELPIAIFAYKSFKKIKKSKVFIDPNLLLATVSMKKYRKN